MAAPNRAMSVDTHDRTILVTGATGNQGGAAARHLLGDGWQVRALVRDAAAPAADALTAAGAELVRGNLDDRPSIDAIESLDHIEAVDATWVLPGHGPAWDGGVPEAVRLIREAAGSATA